MNTNSEDRTAAKKSKTTTYHKFKPGNFLIPNFCRPFDVTFEQILGDYRMNFGGCNGGVDFMRYGNSPVCTLIHCHNAISWRQPLIHAAQNPIATLQPTQKPEKEYKIEKYTIYKDTRKISVELSAALACTSNPYQGAMW